MIYSITHVIFLDESTTPTHGTDFHFSLTRKQFDQSFKEASKSKMMLLKLQSKLVKVGLFEKEITLFFKLKNAK